MGRSREFAELATAYDSGSSLAFRNRLINGAMTISQRNGTTATAWANAYDLDRWSTSQVSDAVGTVQQINSGGPAGFPSFRRIAVTTADASLSSTQYQWAAVQNIEGYNVADLAWGTADAKSITIQLAVRSTKAGTFSVGIGVGSPAQYIFQNVTISAANTWETKSVTFLGNTTTAPVSTTNGNGISLYIVTAAGTAYQGTANAWTTSVHLASSSNSNFLDTVGTTFDITGVQLEVGSAATPFERRDYGRELQLCQRYFTNSWAGSGKWYTSTNCTIYGRFPVTMRIAPTVTVAASPGNIEETGNANRAVTGVLSVGLTADGGAVNFITAAATNGAFAGLALSANAVANFNAEL